MAWLLMSAVCVARVDEKWKERGGGGRGHLFPTFRLNLSRFVIETSPSFTA